MELVLTVKMGVVDAVDASGDGVQTVVGKGRAATVMDEEDRDRTGSLPARSLDEFGVGLHGVESKGYGERLNEVLMIRRCEVLESRNMSVCMATSHVSFGFELRARSTPRRLTKRVAQLTVANCELDWRSNEEDGVVATWKFIQYLETNRPSVEAFRWHWQAFGPPPTACSVGTTEPRHGAAQLPASKTGMQWILCTYKDQLVKVTGSS